MRRKFIALTILFVLLAVSINPTFAGHIYTPVSNPGSDQVDFSVGTSQTIGPIGEKTVDLLIRVDGSTERLANFIRSIGGKVNYQYKNTPIIAATISLDQWSSVINFSGVVNVEKDGFVQPALDKHIDKPMALEIALSQGETLTAIQASDVADLPLGYDNYFLTGANLTWTETGAGEGTIVAVVDTGTAPNVCLEDAVIGAPGFPDGYNAISDGVPANSTLNYYHGTFVGGVIASLCQVTLNPSSSLYKAINTYLPDYGTVIPILGQAPLSQIYPVKVFPTSGAGSPTSVILDGLDNVLSLKKNGDLDIDIVNMSLGGATLYDGRDSYATFVKALTDANILVVSSAGNDGPTPNTVGSPATSDDGIAVGGLDYALSSRIFYEYLGWAYLGSPGQGEIMRPSDETRVVNFSGRGPLSDGRSGPDISALAMWNFGANPTNGLMWASGTSFSSPTVTGGAALLNAYLEGKGYETNPRLLKNVILAGADANQVGTPWQEHNDQGFGALDVPAALEVLKNFPQTIVAIPQGGNLKANLFKQPVKGKVDRMESAVITLNPSEKVDFILEVNQYTSKVTFDVIEIDTPDNSAFAFWTNALEVNLQSAKRTAADRPISWLWYPYWDGDSFNITVEDGPWTFADLPWAYQPMETGLMKFTLAGDYSNEAPVSFKVVITRENYRDADLLAPYAKAQIKQSELVVIPVSIPEGISQAQFDLNWLRDWSLFPTSDIDMLVYDPEFNLYLDGATLNAPERVVIDSPMPGTWYVLVDGYELYRPDTFNFYLKLK